LDFTELGLKLHDGRCCLAGVTGKFNEGSMVAIMGPSGCGKSTFMNVLCGRATYGTMTGEVTVNGETGNIQDLKRVTGFVPQDDIVHENLTVREQLRYSAELRCPAGTSGKRLQHIVEDVLHVLQMKHIQKSVVGSVEKRGISGGQRKRVNIGLELAACPVLLFLDEPTSGLDSTSSLSIVSSLKKMTSLKMTIVMVIHQPRYSLFELFDDVLLLGKGGLTCYQGPAGRAKDYFQGLGFQLPQHENPADWFMDVLSGEAEHDTKKDFTLAEIASKWRESGGSQDAREPPMTEGGAMMHVKTGSYAAVLKFFEEEWEKIDINKDDVLSLAELQQVLSACAGLKLDVDASRDIMNQIKQGSESVNRAEFAAFITERAEKLLNDVVEDLDDVPATQDSGTGGAISSILAQTVPHHWPEGIGSSSKGLATLTRLERKVPGTFRQYRIILHRRMVQWWGSTRRRFTDVCLVVLCAGLMAFNARFNDSSMLSATVFMNLGLFLLATVSGLRVFADRPVFWRESGRGVSVFAFFYGRYSAELIDMFIQTTTYVAVYYLILQPEASFEVFFVPCLFGAWVASGWSYVVACFIGPGNATVAAAVFMLCLAGLLPQPSLLTDAVGKGDILDVVLGLSPTRWALQMIFLGYHEEVGGPYEPQPDCTPGGDLEAEASNHMSAIGIHRMDLDMKTAFESSAILKSMGPQGSGIFALTLQALLLQMIGFLLLKYTNRSKQV
jgi:ABC-type multidrug transport system ATPase subunit